MLWLLVLLACGSAPAPAAPSAEVAPAARPAQVLDHVEVTVGEGGRTIVAVHGLGDAPERFAGAFRGYPSPARFVFPRAPHPHGRGGTWMPADRRDEVAYAESVRVAADRLAAFLATLDGPPPVVTGFSQGGILSFALAVLHPDDIALAVPVAGWLPRPLWPEEGARVAPIRALHGDADTVLPLGPTQAGVAHLDAIGADVELAVFEGAGHQVTGEMRRVWWGEVGGER